MQRGEDVVRRLNPERTSQRDDLYLPVRYIEDDEEESNNEQQYLIRRSGYSSQYRAPWFSKLWVKLLIAGVTILLFGYLIKHFFGRHDKGFEPSIFDRREYKGIILDNGLEVLLASNPDGSAYSAAALSVGVGSWNDPKSRPGLAHLLEHMLFLGSRDFPEEDGFNKFLSSHDGSTNAYTAGDMTVYYFSVSADYFADALAQFSGFFTHPLLHSASLEREILAVNQEHERNKNEDEWRMYQALKSSSNPDTPYFRFTTGSTQSLVINGNNDSLTSELKNFYTKYYSANIMRLVLIGNEDIDQLESIAQKQFSEIKNLNTPSPIQEYKDLNPFPLTYTGHRINVVAISSTHRIQLVWPIPINVTFDDMSSPFPFITYLLSQRMNGGLYDLLLQSEMLTDFGVDLVEKARWTPILSIYLEVNSDSFDLSRVLGIVYAYIQLLSQSNKLAMLFDEWKKSQNILYQSNQGDPISIAPLYASRLQFVGIKDVLEPTSRFQFLPDIYREIMGFLTVENMLIIDSSPNFEATEHWKIEPHYNMQYTGLPFSSDEIKTWKLSINTIQQSLVHTIRLHLPVSNELLKINTDDLRVHSESHEGVPTLLRDTKESRLYLRTDSTFERSYAIYYFEIFLPALSPNPRDKVLFDIYVRLLEIISQNEVYRAAMIASNVEISSTSYSLIIKLSGYRAKFNKFATSFFEVLFANDPIPDWAFRMAVNAALSDLQEVSSLQAYEQAIYVLKRFVNGDPSAESKLSYLEKLQNSTFKESLRPFISTLYSTMYVQAYCYGDASAGFAQEILNKFWQMAKDSLDAKTLSSGERESVYNLRLQNIHIPPRDDWYIHEENSHHNDQNNAVILHIPLCSLSHLYCAPLADALVPAMNAFAFNLLRTKEQLGYIVHVASLMHSSNYLSVNIIVQGSDHSASDIDKRIMSFLETFRINFKDIPLGDYLLAAVKSKSAKIDSLERMAERDWSELVHYEPPNFNRSKQEINSLLLLQREDVLEFYANHIWNPNSSGSRRFHIQIGKIDHTNNNKNLQQSTDSTATLLKHRHFVTLANLSSILHEWSSTW